MKLVGSLFLFWLSEVVQDKEPTEFFPQEFRSRILGDRLVGYRDPIRLPDRTGKTSVPGPEKHLMLRMMSRPLMAWVNGYWNRSLFRRLDFREVRRHAEERSAWPDWRREELGLAEYERTLA